LEKINKLSSQETNNLKKIRENPFDKINPEAYNKKFENEEQRKNHQYNLLV